MICSEQEAKTKWCPKAMYKYNQGNRELGCGETCGVVIPEACMCLEYRCMSWVWQDHDCTMGCCGPVHPEQPTQF